MTEAKQPEAEAVAEPPSQSQRGQPRPDPAFKEYIAEQARLAGLGPEQLAARLTRSNAWSG